MVVSFAQWRGRPILPFWSGFLERNRARIESWIDDQLEYLLQITSVVFAFGVFKGLRLIRIEGWVIDLLELMDRIAIVLVFARFLYSVVRRAFTPSEGA
jgi:hypothetical protein